MVRTEKMQASIDFGHQNLPFGESVPGEEKSLPVRWFAGQCAPTSFQPHCCPSQHSVRESQSPKVMVELITVLRIALHLPPFATTIFIHPYLHTRSVCSRCRPINFLSPCWTYTRPTLWSIRTYAVSCLSVSLSVTRFETRPIFFPVFELRVVRSHTLTYLIMVL